MLDILCEESVLENNNGKYICKEADVDIESPAECLVEATRKIPNEGAPFQWLARGYGGLLHFINGKLYAIGGHSGVGGIRTNEEYDPVTNSWTTKTGMPTARYYHTAASINGKLYAIGGFDGVNGLSTTEAYDPVTDS